LYRWVRQVVTKLIGVHLALHPPPTSTRQLALASTWMLPQASRPAAEAGRDQPTSTAAAHEMSAIIERMDSSSEWRCKGALYCVCRA
jgi:hypothetical protein